MHSVIIIIITFITNIPYYINDNGNKNHNNAIKYKYRAQ